ncbi:MAG: hypothetical protein RLZZ241_1632 [Bacteroidota bacterium]|jgi:hypothetical protein
MILKLFLGFSLFCGSFANPVPEHKFYVSVTHVEYAEASSAIQIISRIFIDDMEEILQERYGIKAGLATDHESATATGFIEKYLRAKMVVSINGLSTKFNYLGQRYERDLLICYLEIPAVAISNLRTLEVENKVLMDIFEEQRNLIHFKVQEHKKSVVLTTENTKAMLNL